MPEEIKTHTHTVLLHGLEYDADVTAKNEDGSFEVLAIALNNGQPFALSHVQKAPADVTGLDPNTPFLRRAKAGGKAPSAPPAADPTDPAKV